MNESIPKQGVSQVEQEENIDAEKNLEVVAMERAKVLFTERIDSSLEGKELVEAAVALMEEFNSTHNKSDYYTMEALAQILSAKKAEQQLQSLVKKYPQAVNNGSYSVAA